MIVTLVHFSVCNLIIHWGINTLHFSLEILCMWNSSLSIRVVSLPLDLHSSTICVFLDLQLLPSFSSFALSNSLYLRLKSSSVIDDCVIVLLSSLEIHVFCVGHFIFWSEQVLQGLEIFWNNQVKEGKEQNSNLHLPFQKDRIVKMFCFQIQKESWRILLDSCQK